METILLIVCVLLVWIGIEWLIDPEKALKWDFHHALFYPHSDPSDLYFILTRIAGGFSALLGLVLAGVILWETFGK